MVRLPYWSALVVVLVALNVRSFKIQTGATAALCGCAQWAPHCESRCDGQVHSVLQVSCIATFLSLLLFLFISLFFRMLGILPSESLSFSYDNDICRRLVEGDDSKSTAGDLHMNPGTLNRTQLLSSDDNKSDNINDFTQEQLQVFDDYRFLIDMNDSKLIDESLSLP
jgi:hypothetical protein